MAGLSLMAGGGVTAALPPSQAAGTQTITQMAYGVGSGADAGAGKKVAGLGTAAGAFLGTAILAWLWWTLPH
jgi:hypothetical protein